MRFSLLETHADHCLIKMMLWWSTWQEGPCLTKAKVYRDGRLEVWSPEGSLWIDSKDTCLNRTTIRRTHFKVYSGQSVYNAKSEIPAILKRGTNIQVTSADPDNEGWWKSTGPALRRLVPDYHCSYTDYSKESKPWPSDIV